FGASSIPTDKVGTAVPFVTCESCICFASCIRENSREWRQAFHTLRGMSADKGRKRPIINFWPFERATWPFERATVQGAHISKRAPCFPLVSSQTAQTSQEWLVQDRPAISILDHLKKTRRDNPFAQKPICEWKLCHMKACAPGRGHRGPGRGHRGPERYEQSN